jgi:hypothetical protein
METSSRIAQNGCEHGDKHLATDMIPVNLTMVESSHRAAARGAGAAEPLISLGRNSELRH